VIGRDELTSLFDIQGSGLKDRSGYRGSRNVKISRIVSFVVFVAFFYSAFTGAAPAEEMPVAYQVTDDVVYATKMDSR
jgi:hypothetical protein